MISDITGQVLKVEGRTTRTGRTLYDIFFSDGNKYTAFEGGIAQQAQALQGQQAQARVEVKPSQDGRYTNMNLLAIGQPGTLGPAPTPGTPVGGVGIPMAQPGAAAPVAGIPMAQPSSGGGGRGMSDEDKHRIVRQSAASTAFDFIGSIFAGSGPEGLDQAIGLARRLTEDLAAHAWTGLYGGTIRVLPSGATAQDVAAAVPGVQVGTEGIAPPADPSQTQGTELPWDAA